MLLTSTALLKILPIVRFELYRTESSFLIQSSLITKILIIAKNHFGFQYKVLTCISGVDYQKNSHRFRLVYELLSLKYNSRLRVKVLLNELTPIDTVEKIFLAASWWECEIWDMFGVFFANQSNLTRLLTDYGFQGHPLKKDFPLGGFTESRYNIVKSRVVYENLELAQEFRTFEYMSPWENLK